MQEEAIPALPAESRTSDSHSSKLKANLEIPELRRVEAIRGPNVGQEMEPKTAGETPQVAKEVKEARRKGVWRFKNVRVCPSAQA